MLDSADAVYETHLRSLPLHYRGKVRDVYRIDDEHLLIVATDRLSAFDVILPQPIPGKGRILTELSNFWFARMQDIVPNHLCAVDLAEVIPISKERALLAGRAVVVRKLQALPVEAIVRGYLVGSGWKEYQQQGSVCGLKLPAGLQQAEQLPAVIYTPSTKAALGTHDENVAFEHTVDLLGRELAERIRALSIAIYTRAAAQARSRGIIIADTKFEFGLDQAGNVVLIDELLTPDSSRFWPADGYRVGISPPSFDKQFVRDYLETLAWDKTPPAPVLPAEIIEKTAAKYAEAKARLMANIL
jgi:phosphoribosylaminoimidazole-succinocarboxamide synthase